MGDAAWDRALAGWRDYCRAAGQSPTTLRTRGNYLARLVVAADHPWMVTTSDLLAFVATPGWSPETRRSARSALRSFYGWATLVGHVDRSPAADLPPVRVPRGLPHPTPEQLLEAALDRATDRDRLMLLLGAYAGLRRGEIARLAVDDVAGPALAVIGKGGRHRQVPVHSRLAAPLVNAVQCRRSGALLAGSRFGDPASPWLFPGQSSGPITPDAVGRILARGLGMRGHSLRHRFATRAYAGTRDLRAVQELLGHSRPETTAIYTLIGDEALRRAVDAA